MAEEPTVEDMYPATAEGEPLDLRRALGPVSLVSIGIGAIIGAGIFVITGHAAAEYAGPAVVISFIIAGLGCLFAGLCYAEFASMIPVSGSAYTYGYATLGQFFGWVIGWDLVLEYLMASSTVGVGWAGYFKSFMASLGVQLPPALSQAPLDFVNGHFVWTGAILNVPAVALICFVSGLLIIGVRESRNFNNVMVAIKLSIVLMVILFGLPLIHLDNLKPFVPPNTTGEFGHFGWSGVLRASGVIFFAYIGFDAVSVAAQEAKNPQRDMPIGILGSLAICTLLYILMSTAMTGLLNYTQLDVPNPAFAAVNASPALQWLAPLVSFAAVVGLATVVLVLLYGQSRIFYAMSRDGFLPKIFSTVHPKYRTPWLGTMCTMVVASLFAGFLPLSVLGELVSIGTLAAFVIVCIGVMVLRYTKPNVKRPFRTPFVPVVPLLGILICGLMMVWLPADTWIRLAIWFFIGLVIYGFYGRKNAKEPDWGFEIEEE